MTRRLDDTPAALAHMAARSLEDEARLAPKPGLVDSINNGAHADMELATFLASAAALEPLFAEYAASGMHLGCGSPSELAVAARRIGIRAEKAMFSATGGVNTHKGANFTFALVLSATGALLADGSQLPFDAAHSARALELVSRMAEGLLDADVRALLARAAQGEGAAGELSHGEQLFLAEGLKGVRGEAAQGYPLLARVLLPYLRSSRSELAASDEGRRETLLRALVKLMAQLEDTNVVHRGGMEALASHRAYCSKLDAADLSFSELELALSTYDRELIALNVSPGGAADLLSLGIFFMRLEGLDAQG